MIRKLGNTIQVTINFTNTNAKILSSPTNIKQNISKITFVMFCIKYFFNNW